MELFDDHYFSESGVAKSLPFNRTRGRSHHVLSYSLTLHHKVFEIKDFMSIESAR
jgi:hypothetical protein